MNDNSKTNYPHVFDAICGDQRYQKNIDWGRPRSGHPEGTIRAHIGELEGNLKRLRSRLDDTEYWKLRILIHTHDTFKADARSGISISDPRSHASLARAFLAEFCDDEDLLNMLQLHDKPYALWKKHNRGGDVADQLDKLLGAIDDWNLFTAFLIIDNCTHGKTRQPLQWFLEQIDGRVASTFGTADALPASPSAID